MAGPSSSARRHGVSASGHWSSRGFLRCCLGRVSTLILKTFSEDRSDFVWPPSCSPCRPSGVVWLPPLITEGDDNGFKHSDITRPGRCHVPGCCPESQGPESLESKRPG